MSDARLHLVQHWLAALGLPVSTLRPASADASFRRYFRVWVGERSFIVMDAPPDKEDCRPFVQVAEVLRRLGVNVPRIHEMDLERGLLLLSDFGDRSYLRVLDAGNATALYGDALETLLRIQAGGADDLHLPLYDAALLRQEMALFQDWYVERHLGIHWPPAARAAWQEACERLVVAALEQPRVWVHRDYHSRNLMVVPEYNPGVLDFQDAVMGPLSYDLVSLLRDCYIRWPQERLDEWLAHYHRRAREQGLLDGLLAGRWPEITPALLRRWFDWMGVQRHLKAVGIFARLWHRDGKPGYLRDIPRTLSYLLDVTGRYRELAGLQRLLQDLPTPVTEPGGRRERR